jgi:hypothetical protein
MAVMRKAIRRPLLSLRRPKKMHPMKMPTKTTAPIKPGTDASFVNTENDRIELGRTVNARTEIPLSSNFLD